jgi:hypothetical protein
MPFPVFELGLAAFVAPPQCDLHASLEGLLLPVPTPERRPAKS